MADEASKAVPPVFARLWFLFCSASDGERERLRVDSLSGMVASLAQFDRFFREGVEMDWGWTGKRWNLESDGYVRGREL